ncbi:Eukaryotic translation initiation factor 3 subunit A like protein [Aduncisulcus paluster]|uniref:Eukaryotic translation initiation factor 3 subunit A like protein n=1 Tax=Aduncisulcus paluster TaxID=2918883 RepID=A0ABQ5JUC7_9EUKA|nr:Eukaryotic translation initiation factor 3 subunit A like protein [Aduncisulcus paluster]
MQANTKAESALNHARELRKTKLPSRAIDDILEFIVNGVKKQSSWIPVYGDLMEEYINCCFILDDHIAVNDGLSAYRSAFLGHEPKALAAVVLQLFHRLSPEMDEIISSLGHLVDSTRVEEGKVSFELWEEALIEASSLSVGKMSHKPRVAQHLTFVWRSLLSCIDTVRFSQHLEYLYQDIAEFCIDFCVKYQRVAEFQSLCEILQKHLQRMLQFVQDKHEDQDAQLTSPDTQNMHILLRLKLMDAATKLKCHSLTYKTAEDLAGLFKLSGATERFWNNEQYTSLNAVSTHPYLLDTFLCQLFHIFPHNFTNLSLLCVQRVVLRQLNPSFFTEEGPEVILRLCDAALVYFLCIPPASPAVSSLFASCGYVRGPSVSIPSSIQHLLCLPLSWQQLAVERVLLGCGKVGDSKDIASAVYSYLNAHDVTLMCSSSIRNLCHHIRGNKVITNSDELKAVVADVFVKLRPDVSECLRFKEQSGLSLGSLTSLPFITDDSFVLTVVGVFRNILLSWTHARLGMMSKVSIRSIREFLLPVYNWIDETEEDMDTSSNVFVPAIRGLFYSALRLSDCLDIDEVGEAVVRRPRSAEQAIDKVVGAMIRVEDGVGIAKGKPSHEENIMKRMYHRTIHFGSARSDTEQRFLNFQHRRMERQRSDEEERERQKLELQKKKEERLAQNKEEQEKEKKQRIIRRLKERIARQERQRLADEVSKALRANPKLGKKLSKIDFLQFDKPIKAFEKKKQEIEAVLAESREVSLKHQDRNLDHLIRSRREKEIPYVESYNTYLMEHAAEAYEYRVKKLEERRKKEHNDMLKMRNILRKIEPVVSRSLGKIMQRNEAELAELAEKEAAAARQKAKEEAERQAQKEKEEQERLEKERQEQLAAQQKAEEEEKQRQRIINETRTALRQKMKAIFDDYKAKKKPIPSFGPMRRLIPEITKNTYCLDSVEVRAIYNELSGKDSAKQTLEMQGSSSGSGSGAYKPRGFRGKPSGIGSSWGSGSDKGMWRSRDSASSSSSSRPSLGGNRFSRSGMSSFDKATHSMEKLREEERSKDRESEKKESSEASRSFVPSFRRAAAKSEESPSSSGGDSSAPKAFVPAYKRRGGGSSSTFGSSGSRFGSGFGSGSGSSSSSGGSFGNWRKNK